MSNNSSFTAAAAILRREENKTARTPPTIRATSIIRPPTHRMIFLLALLLLLLTVPSFVVAAASANTDENQNQNFWTPTADGQSHAASANLFQPSDEIRVNAPSRFPKPTRPLSLLDKSNRHSNKNVTVIVEPTFGQHRPDQDAILAYAEGYRLPYYMQFLETLTETGYRGDVVLAIAEERILRERVVEYLKTFAQGDTENKPNLIVYQEDLFCEARNGSTEHVRGTVPNGDTDVFQMCQLNNVYGVRDAVNGKIIESFPDPRDGRVVATLRYEWYWIWSQHYQPHTWLMLIDARDSYFQSNPFANLPREDTPNSPRPDGLLYFFGENANATRLGKSKKNLKWLQKGYGDKTLKALADKPTICSGSTMGEQIAIETYLRAMVNEHDECDIKMTGSDQGFHNYLFYSSKLTNADTIRRLVVWEQGRGIINNLGALRIKTLNEWGILDPGNDHGVYQWDGRTKSPVVHQWDRDKELHSYIYGQRHREWSKQFEEYLEQQEGKD